VSDRLFLIEPSGYSSVPSIVPLLASEGFQFTRVTWESLSPKGLQNCQAQLIVPVATSPSEPPMAFFDSLRKEPVAIPTLAVLSNEATEELFRAAARVVDDLILWPVQKREFSFRAARLLGLESRNVESVESRLLIEIGISQLVGAHPVFTRAIAKIPLIARSGAPVLITGETGTGKELCARAIHHFSNRREFPFIPVDCSGLPDHLLENELFGHARGAFTDAHGEQKGLVAMAGRGTLFLDEIDALSLTAQAKLLRFLQEKTYKPLGADRFLRADVNLLAATNRDLEAAVRERQFRSDLYFRLNVLRLDLPPLRARPTDILILARHFLGTFRPPGGSVRKTLSLAAQRKLSLYSWPGNVRELLNTLQRAVVFAEGVNILPCHILLPEPHGVIQSTDRPFREARARAIETFERAYLEDLLNKHGGNITRAAADAGKERRALGRLVKKHRLKPSSA
jgi:DNA-binding NtrC family response regulator